MTDDENTTATPTADAKPQDERDPGPAEERKLSVDDVDAEDGEDVKVWRAGRACRRRG